MKVSLVDWTGAGSGDIWFAADRLIFTKSTRVTMSPGLLGEIEGWSKEKKMEELRYMSRTIPSSWEFVHYTFVIEDVTRAFTHQIVRTRTGNYAQQNLSVQRATNWGYRTGPSIKGNARLETIYDTAMEHIRFVYDELVDAGAKVEDARGILPTNIHNNIVVKWDLRTCCDTFRKRASSERGHGEYHEVIAEMRARIIEVHPWATVFLNRDADIASREAYDLIKTIPDKDLRMNLSKAIDEIMTRG
jgi:thymidylate synthase ThyX